MSNGKRQRKVSGIRRGRRRRIRRRQGRVGGDHRALSMDDAVQSTHHGHHCESGWTLSVEIGLMPVLHALIGSIRILVMMMSGPVFSHPSLSPRMRLMGAFMIAWVAGPIGVGGSRLIESVKSGAPVVAGANSGNLGGIRSSALEKSNVDLAAQCVNLIVAQRAFQANTRRVRGILRFDMGVGS